MKIRKIYKTTRTDYIRMQVDRENGKIYMNEMLQKT